MSSTNRSIFALIFLLALSACAQTNKTDLAGSYRPNIPRADMPDSVREALSNDLAALQQSIALPRISGPLPGPLSDYETFGTASRGGAVMSSPSDRAQVVTTIYPGTVMGLSGKKVGVFTEVGYEYYGNLLRGWVDPSKVGLTSAVNPAILTAKEKQALYRRILDQVNELVEKWAENPYLSIGSFSINVDQAPSVNVDIRYK